MNLSRFIALRIYRSSDVGKQVSRPAVLIATIGVAIGLVVMIIAVSVIIGFKSEVRDKIIGFGSHIQISNSDAARSFETRPIAVTDSMLAALADNSGVKHVQRYSTKPGMIKTSDAFQGMVLKGIGPEYGSSFFRRHLIEGEFPQFSDSASTNRVVVSKAIADKLKQKQVVVFGKVGLVDADDCQAAGTHIVLYVVGVYLVAELQLQFVGYRL